MKKLLQLIKKLKNAVKDLNAKKYLKRHVSEKINENVKVAFLVFEPETWDKQEVVYELLNKKKNVQVDVIVLPNFDKNFSVGEKYGEEYEFFKGKCDNVIKAYNENGELYNLKKAHYDYVFYEDQYNVHYPKQYRTNNVNKHSKVCCIPYGFNQSDVFLSCYSKDFFRSVFIVFAPSKSVKDFLIKDYYKTYRKGLQHFEMLGYPVLEKYIDLGEKNEAFNSVLWTPRWSYDPVIGGSHFFEYKNVFSELNEKYKKTKFFIRPHPMMFTEFVKDKLMTEEDVKEYKSEMEKSGIEISKNGSGFDDFARAGILISDFSSVVLTYFLMNRPLIYCPNNVVFSEDYQMLVEGMYIANSEDDIKKYLNELLNGNDYLKEKRKKIIDVYREKHKNSGERIVEYLLKGN